MTDEFISLSDSIFMTSAGSQSWESVHADQTVSIWAIFQPLVIFSIIFSNLYKWPLNQSFHFSINLPYCKIYPENLSLLY